MQSPEMQQAMQVLMQDARSQTARKGGTAELGLPEIPDSLRAPFAAAVASGQFDNAKAIARKAMSGTPVENAQLDIAMKFLEFLPDTLRSFVTADLFSGYDYATQECSSPGMP